MIGRRSPRSVSLLAASVWLGCNALGPQPDPFPYAPESGDVTPASSQASDDDVSPVARGAADAAPARPVGAPADPIVGIEAPAPAPLPEGSGNVGAAPVDAGADADAGTVDAGLGG